MSERILLLLERSRELICTRFYDDIDEALQHAEPVTEAGCGCSFGVCIRDENKKGEKDWYEPCEPELESQGLPWFYFCDPQKLKKKDRYRRKESD